MKNDCLFCAIIDGEIPSYKVYEDEQCYAFSDIAPQAPTQFLEVPKEHICCAMSGKQSLAKKEWLKQRFEEGLVFYRSAERGKCFIEYIPAENAWVPIDADGYLYINCLWVSGSLKGHGYSSELLEECLRDAKAQGKNGVCILCAEGRKREFLADPKFLTHKGFKVSDTSDCGINLMYLPLAESAQPPKFKACATHPKVEENGYHLNTGFLSTPFLCEVLAKYGYADTAYKLLLQDTAPSWLYEVKQGATTVWETWTGIDANGHPSESLNHYSYGAICGWLFGGVCGIRLAGETLTIAPTPNPALGWAKAVYDSPVGRIESGWQYAGDAVTYTITVPCNRTAEVTLPDGRSLTLQPGTHTL